VGVAIGCVRITLSERSTALLELFGDFDASNRALLWQAVNTVSATSRVVVIDDLGLTSIASGAIESLVGIVSQIRGQGIEVKLSLTFAPLRYKLQDEWPELFALAEEPGDVPYDERGELGELGEPGQIPSVGAAWSSSDASPVAARRQTATVVAAIDAEIELAKQEGLLPMRWGYLVSSETTDGLAAVDITIVDCPDAWAEADESRCTRGTGCRWGIHLPSCPAARHLVAEAEVACMTLHRIHSMNSPLAADPLCEHFDERCYGTVSVDDGGLARRIQPRPQY